jgi:hypothetical protein
MILAACGGEPNSESTGKPVISPGERMYREGILTTGEPMTALVAGDVPIVGTAFSCESCHGRSGMGAAEGDFIVPPVAAQFLFKESPQPKRPAYDRESLARLLREGVTPSGRVLSPELMPRYELTDTDVQVLVAYLETLSPGDSPGVDDKTIRFATVVTETVDASEREAVVGVVRRFAEDINRKTRNETERWDRGYTPESKLPTVFREWVIDEWLLTGPPSTWKRQLDSYYEKAPVFAVVGGMGKGSWVPVSEFCENNKIPCLYPSTDVPWRANENFYTVYSSPGLLLEADLVAAHLASEPAPTLTQVVCDPDLEPVVEALQQSLLDTDIRSDTIAFDCDDTPPALADSSTYVLWLDRATLQNLPLETFTGRVYISSMLLDGDIQGVTTGAEVLAAHPFRLPGKPDPSMRRFRLWAESRGVELVAPRQQAEAYFACLVINDAVKHMGRFRIREFALDMMDHAEGLASYVPFYPRPSFGPGQRFINKGGYILPVIDGEPATSEATWITP